MAKTQFLCLIIFVIDDVIAFFEILTGHLEIRERTTTHCKRDFKRKNVETSTIQFKPFSDQKCENMIVFKGLITFNYDHS